MPENSETPKNLTWCVGIAGREHELLVPAAYIATNAADTQDTKGAPLVTLKNADHKVAFQSTAGAVLYVRQYDGFARAEEFATQQGQSPPCTLPSPGPAQMADAPTAMIPLPGGLNISPGQLRDLQDSVNEAIGMGCIKAVLLPPGSSVAAHESQAPQ